MINKYLLSFCIALYSGITLSQEVDATLLNELSTSEIELIKNQIQNNSNSLSSEDSKTINESIKEVDSTKTNSYGNKYGYNFINSIPTSIVATGDLPLPNDYKISLNDQFTIILSGSRKAIFDLNVNLNGTILFPELGSISVAGDSYGEVKTKLKNLIEQSYIGVQIDISLKNLSAKKVTIVGAVNTPGTYLVNPFSTISSALAYSGGISDVGTLRNIKLTRVNGDVFYFDLYDLLINGDRSNDITIEAGDVILINPAYQFVEIDGEIKRPATYEIKKNETIKDLLNFSLGFNYPNLNKILLTKLDQKNNKIELINTSNLDLDLKNIISINVFGFNNEIESSIYVQGAVREPGYYEIDESETLESIIKKFDFVDVYPWVAVLEQFDSNNIIKSSTLFNLKDKSTIKNIKILPKSRLFFANLKTRSFPSDLDPISIRKLDDYTLTLTHKQGTYRLPVYGRYKVIDFVNLLGLDMSDVNDVARYTSPIESIVLNLNYKEMEFDAKKYNFISFRSPVNDLITVTISGAIDYPGTYVLPANSSIVDLYKLVGNFKPEAFIKGIILTRQSVRERQLQSLQQSRDALNESILVKTQRGENIGNISVIQSLFQEIEPKNLGRIAGDFSPSSDASIRTVLFDGDSIIVPKNPNVINVFGEVLNPISFEFIKGLSVRNSIERAGGYKDYAHKSKVYVIKANGIIEKVNRNIFVRNVKLEAGDTIVVPRKIITNNPGIEFLLPVTQILSDMAFSAAAIESLSNN